MSVVKLPKVRTLNPCGVVIMPFSREERIQSRNDVLRLYFEEYG